MKKTARKMNVSVMSDDELQDLFSDAFQEQIASRNDIGEFEAICHRLPSKDSLSMEVTIFGFAGTPPVTFFKDAKNKKIASVLVNNEDRGSLKFVLTPSETIALNTNDYLVIYKAN